MYIDTHAHLYLDDFKEDFGEIEHRLELARINEVYLPNIDGSTIQSLKDLALKNPKRFFPMAGLHPCYVKENYKHELALVHKEIESGFYCAVGEIGIDLHWDTTFEQQQHEAFVDQILLAKAHNLPFVIHSRKALDLTIKTVVDHQDGSLTGIFHCFNGTQEQAQKIMDVGFLMGIGGVVTYKNAGVDKVVKDIPLEHLVLETDAPYLSPSPHRGKRNEPSYIPNIANKIAELKDLKVEEIAEITTKNAKKLFDKRQEDKK